MAQSLYPRRVSKKLFRIPGLLLDCDHVYTTPSFTSMGVSSEFDFVPSSPTADRVALNLKIISENFKFRTRRTWILMGFIIYYWELIVNPMGRILVRWKSFGNNFKILPST